MFNDHMEKADLADLNKILPENSTRRLPASRKNFSVVSDRCPLLYAAPDGCRVVS